MAVVRSHCARQKIPSIVFVHVLRRGHLFENVECSLAHLTRSVRPVRNWLEVGRPLPRQAHSVYRQARIESLGATHLMSPLSVFPTTIGDVRPTTTIKHGEILLVAYIRMQSAKKGTDTHPVGHHIVLAQHGVVHGRDRQLVYRGRFGGRKCPRPIPAADGAMYKSPKAHSRTIASR